MNNKLYQNNSIIPSLNRSIYSIKTLGIWAHQYLAQKRSACILGVTSEGVFLQTQNGEIIFLTDKSYRGPLTVNLQNKINFKECFSIGEEMTILRDRLVFAKCQVIYQDKTLVWTPYPVEFAEDGLHQALGRGIALVKSLIGVYKEGLYFPFLDQLATDFSEITKDSLWTFLPEVELPNFPGNQLLRYLGLGNGLTPAGDDFLVGFLLAQYFLNKVFPSSASFEDLKTCILAEAKKQTTALSTAMLNCALEGTADERLLACLSWIAEGKPPVEKVRAGILSYGSSSGVDTLAGMLTAVLIQTV